MKDWTGNNRTLGATLGASYLASGERPREDYYATHPDMVRDLLNAGAPLRKRVWEPACGAGHIVKVLRLQFLEGKARRRLYDVAPPADVWVFSERRTCAKNGDFSKTEGGAIAYAWFHWIKGHSGNCTIKWL